MMRTLPIVVLLSLACASCVDPQARYDDFIERTSDLRKPDAGRPTEPGDRFDWSGHYFLALSTSLSPDAPLLFAVDAEVSSDLTDISLQLQPLATDDDDEPREPVGDRLDIDAIAYEEDGTFSADLGAVSVPGRANPITGSDIVANVQLTGAARAGEGGDAPIFCGQVTGMVSEPIMLDLSGSTFGAVQTEDERDAAPILRCPNR